MFTIFNDPRQARRRRRRLAFTVAGALLAVPGAAAAEWGDEECKKKCPATPPPKPTWTTNKGFVQCVEYVRYRSGITDHSGNAWTWAADYPACDQAAPGAHCVSEEARPGTILVCSPNTNQCGDVGHVAVVECIVGDWAQLSEYNWVPPGVYKGDRCVNVKAARDRGTPYKFLRPRGGAFEVGEHCENPIKIVRAQVKPNADVQSGTVTVEFSAPQCSRAKYTLHREVYKFADGGYQKLAQHSWSRPVWDVLANYEDTFDGVPPCSQFVYTLEREMVDPPIVGAKIKVSEPMIGVNLEAVKFFAAYEVPNAYGQAILRWQDVCADYKGKDYRGKPLPKTQYQITHVHGNGGEVKVGVVDGNVVSMGAQTREWKLAGLAAGSTYTIRMRTYNFTDLAAAAAEWVFTTRGANNTPVVPVPQRPTLAMDCKTGKLGADWPASKGVDDYEALLTHPDKHADPPVAVTKDTEVLLVAPKDGDYKVQLRSVVAGKMSAWTDPVVQQRDCVAEPPTNLAVADDGCTGVKLTWGVDPAATATNLKQFAVFRQAAGDAEPAIIGMVPPALRTFTDVVAEPDKSYEYSVRAIYQTPDGRTLTSVKAALGGVTPKTAPRTPEIMDVKIDVDRARLTFIDRATNETGFVVKRWTDVESGAVATYELPPNPGIGTVVWDEPAALPQADRNFRYRVYAAKGACKLTSLIPSEHVDTRRLAPPVNLTVAAGDDGNFLKWLDGNHVKSSQSVYRKLLTADGWSSQAVGGTGVGVYEWTDKDKVAAQYAVKPRYTGARTTSEGPLSLPVTLLRTPPAKPCAPAGVKPELTAVTNVDDPERSRLTFKYDAGPTFVARVEYARAAAGPWLALHETKATAGPLDVDVSPFMNQKIWLRVVGYDTVKGCLSAPSASVTAFPLPAPLEHPTLTRQKSCPEGMLVRWTDSSTYGSKFQVEYRTSKVGLWQAVPTDKWLRSGNEVTYCHSPVPAFANYSYRVRSTVQVPRQGGGFDLVSASKWSIESDLTQTETGDLALINGNMEVPHPDPNAGTTILGWKGGAWTTHLPKYARANNQSLGLRFGYYASEFETVSQVLPLEFMPAKTYTFKGWVTGGGDNKGKVPFQIGYLEDLDDPKTFKPLATKVYPATASWALVAGVSYLVKPDDVAIGKRIVVRLGTKADGGETDIWFDNLAASVVSK